VKHPHQKRLLVGSYVGMVSLSTQINTLAVCLVPIARTFDGLTQAQMGLISTLSFVGVVVGILGAGPLADRYGMRPFIILGAALELVGQALMGLAPNYGLLLMLSVVGGLGVGMLDALLSPLVCHLCDEARASALNLLHAFYCIGAVATVAGASFLLKHEQSWRVIFPVMTAPSILCGLVFVATPFPHWRGPREAENGLRGMLRRPLFLVLVLTMFLAGANELAAAQWIPAYMTKVFGWSEASAGMTLMGFSVSMAVGRLLASGMTRRVSPMRLLLAATSLGLCSLAAAVLSNSGASAAVGFCALGLAVGPLWPTVLAYTAEHVPHGGATLFSILAGVGNGGGVIGPVAVGLVADRLGLRGGMGIVALAAIALLAIFLGRARAERLARTGLPKT